MLVRATTKSYNKIIPDVILGLKKNRLRADEYLVAFFKNQNVESAYWPDDLELSSELRKLEFYRRIYRSRVRMVFEGLEDYFRGWVNNEESLSGTRVKRQKYAIEHIMPRSWQANWPLPKEINELERDRAVHTLGNLTLLTSKLNSKVSNSAWSEKKKHVNEHDLLQLNKHILQVGAENWTDQDIADRTELLISAILQIWPAPSGHQVNRRKETNRWSSSVSVADLISAGLIAPGQILYSRPGRHGGFTAKILIDGRIEVEGQIRDSLSLAGAVVRKKNTNGWTFWRLDLQTQRTMDEVRHEYESQMGIEVSELDPESDDSEEE
jgi:hypothetical protein